MMDQNKTGTSWEMRDINRTLGNRKRWVQDGFMGECVWAEPGEMGGILTGCERKGNSTWKKSCKKGKTSAVWLWNPAFLCQGLINCFNSLLCFISTLSLHHQWRALHGLLDGWHQESTAPFHSLPLVCVSAVQWELVKFNLEENNVNKNTFLSVGGTVIYAQLRFFPLT